MKYYIICDDTDRIMAIHKIYESAAYCFQSIINKGDFDRFLYIRMIDTDDHGLTIKEQTMMTYSKHLPMIIRPTEPPPASE